MRVRVEIEVNEKQATALCHVAVATGFGPPKHTWTDQERKEAVRYAVHSLLEAELEKHSEARSGL